MLTAVLSVCPPEPPRRYNAFLFPVLAALISAPTIALNFLPHVFLLAPLVAAAALFLASRALSSGSDLLRAVVCTAGPFGVLAVGYLWLLVLCFVYRDGFQDTLLRLVTQGYPRCLYLMLDKLSDAAILIFSMNRLKQLRTLGRKGLWLLLLVSIFSCLVTQYIFLSILSDRQGSLQSVSFFAFLLLLLLSSALSSLFLAISERNRQCALLLAMQMQGRLMERNYQLLHQNLQANAVRLHDFNHHLNAILYMAQEGNCGGILEYVQPLFAREEADRLLSHSGCEIIDAVLNCSAAQADRHQTAFCSAVEIHSDLSQILPTDLCAVLGNLIENALEACQKIPEGEPRFVRVKILQKHCILLIYVTNSVAHSPFQANGTLVTDKEPP